MSEYRLVQHRGNWSLAYDEEERGRVRVALGTPDRGLAEARARDLWKARTAPVSDKVKDLWTSYIADREAMGVTVDAAGSTWKALETTFGHKLGRAVNREDCREHYERRKREKRSDSTIRTELEYLRACLRLKYGKESPVLWMPPPSAPRDRYLTKTELKKLLSHVETPHVRLFIELAIATGARMSAILELTWEYVDLERGTVNLNPSGRHVTNKRRTIVPVRDRALAALVEAKKGALTDNVIEYDGGDVKSIRKAIRSAAIRAKVPCSPHVFRHTAGVWMAEADVPMQKISQFLAHSTTAVTERHYARYSPSFMVDAAKALNW
ncbi:integrase [Sphingomonas paeninsulae]|uniref:Integrase n=1 Tax=Sphingomonas paeninsulae TaxID=2319844 RepID=A0A494TEP1_SPHPE|nr:tyrosine-type recombinase/integrase [Sphingomonas paeninsulae]AYJ85742.1 integrase [Sphingomonas paeninsulae]